jgi:hypothetical protein
MPPLLLLQDGIRFSFAHREALSKSAALYLKFVLRIISKKDIVTEIRQVMPPELALKIRQC